jgi:hypothetical protein
MTTGTKHGGRSLVHKHIGAIHALNDNISPGKSAINVHGHGVPVQPPDKPVFLYRSAGLMSSSDRMQPCFRN